MTKFFAISTPTQSLAQRNFSLLTRPAQHARQVSPDLTMSYSVSFGRTISIRSNRDLASQHPILAVPADTRGMQSFDGLHLQSLTAADPELSLRRRHWQLAYQTLLLGQAHEKNQQLEARLQAVIKEANNEITLLQSRENQLKASCKALESQNQEFKERLTRLVDEKYAKCTPESAAFAMSDGHRPRHSKFPSNLTIAAQKRSLPSTDSQEMPWQSTSRSFLSDSDDTRRSASAKHSGIPSIPSEHSTSIEDNSMIPTETSLLNTNWEPSKNLSRFSPLSSRDGDTPSLSKTKSRRMSSATSNTFDGSSKSKDSLSWLRNVHKPSSSVPPFPSSSHSRSLNSDAAIHRPNSVLGHISGRASNGGASAYAMDRSHSTQSRLG
ncbi:unnamed protein product [Sympodiomycopsis kandeliae]